METIEALIQSLESVLDALDGNSVELGSGADPVMQACTKAFESYRTEAERLKSVERSPELKQRIQHAVKLHALVGAGASREKTKIGENLEASSSRRQFRQAYKAPAVLGESCDMAG